jgi:hypothetical protein
MTERVIQSSRDHQHNRILWLLNLANERAQAPLTPEDIDKFTEALVDIMVEERGVIVWHTTFQDAIKDMETDK